MKLIDDLNLKSDPFEAAFLWGFLFSLVHSFLCITGKACQTKKEQEFEFTMNYQNDNPEEIRISKNKERLALLYCTEFKIMVPL